VPLADDRGAPALPGAQPDRLFAVLAALCVANVALLAPRLLYPDLNLDYPFTDGDSFDWIGNGLYLAGHDVRYSGRPPLLPLVLAVLDRLSLLPWFPILQQILFHLSILAFYRLAARCHSRRAAFVAATALLFNSSVQSLSLDLMADLMASCLLLFALHFFAQAEEEPRAYLGCGLAGAVSALTQKAALLAALPAAVAVLAFRPRHLRSPWLWGGALLFALPQGVWLLYKRLAFGTFGDLLVHHWRLVRPHGESAGTYLYFLASLLGLPGCLLLAAGLLRGLRQARRERTSATRVFALGLFAVLLAFFVFLYDYNAKRFLLYILWPAGFFLSEALAGIADRRAFAAAATLLLAGSALPQPVTGRDGTRVAIWPLPPIYLQAGARLATTGSVTLDLRHLRIERDRTADLLRFSTYARVFRAAAARGERTPALNPALVRADQAVLFLYDEPERGDGYRVVSRLSNALGKRVRFVPRTCLATYAPFLAAEPVGRVAEWAIFRTRVPGLAGTWLLATSGRPPFPPRPERTPDPATLAAGLARARAILDAIGGSDAYVVVLPHDPGSDLSQLDLPFLLRTTELFMAEPGREQDLRAFLATAPVLGERRIGTTLVKRLRIFGREGTLVSYLPE
jgi:dolichyl-phosphate-mannose-protein mannosyltransferase